MGVPAQDRVAPGAPVFRESIKGPGSAHIVYTQPSDLDLMCVVAEYTRSEGGQVVQTKSSPYTDTLFVEGFNASGTYDVKLYSVDLSDNRSEVVLAEIEVDEPAVDVVFQSLQVVQGYGGIQLTWENVTQTNIIISVTMQDEFGDWVDLDQFFTTSASGAASIRGLLPVETNFKVQIEDKWGNTTPEATYTITPLYEEAADKTKFRTVNALPGDSPAWSGGYGIQDIWDGTRFDTGNSCYHSSSMADGKCITFDMGQTFKFSRFNFYPRGGSHRFFTHNAIKYFKIYGALELTPEMYTLSDSQAAQVASGLTYQQVTPELESAGWSLIREADDVTYKSITYNGRTQRYCCYKPSGDDATITADDLDWLTTYGHEFNVSMSSSPARYIRIQFWESWGNTGFYQLAEFDVWGQDQNKEDDDTVVE